MLTKKTIHVYGDDSVINKIQDDSGIFTTVKFLTIHETAFLRVVMSRIIEENTHSHLLTTKQKFELLTKLEKSVLYESVS